MVRDRREDESSVGIGSKSNKVVKFCMSARRNTNAVINALEKELRERA